MTTNRFIPFVVFSSYVVMEMAAAELFRRSMWSWLRIENAVLAHEAKDGLLDMSESKKRELKVRQVKVV